MLAAAARLRREEGVSVGARVALLAVLLVCCGPPSKDDVSRALKDDCAEVDWRTMRDGKTVECRVIMCRVHGGGAPAVLWCDEVKPECGQ